MKKLMYFLAALFFVGLIGFGIYMVVTNAGKLNNNNGTEENKKFTVKFNTNGGNEIEKQEVKKGEKVVKPEEPKKEGFLFINWYLEDRVYNFNLGVGKDLELEARWIPAGKKRYSVTFKYDNGWTDGVVQVEENDTVLVPTGFKKDGYTFKGWYLGNNKFDFNTKITKDIVLVARWEKNAVTPPQPTTVNPTGVSLNKTILKLGRGTSETLIATLTPSNATKTLTWSSSNTSVVTVVNGKVTAVGKGNATITVKTVNGKTATCNVEVDVPLTGLSITKISGYDKLYYGGTGNPGPCIELQANKIPGDTTMTGNVEWFSYDTSGPTGGIYLQPNGNKVKVCPRDSSALPQATVTARFAGFEKSYTVKIESKLTLYNITGDVNPTYPDQRKAGLIKKDGVAIFNFNEQIKEVVSSNNCGSITGLGTTKITTYPQTGGASTPTLITLRTYGGQTIYLHIYRNY